MAAALFGERIQRVDNDGCMAGILLIALFLIGMVMGYQVGVMHKQGPNHLNCTAALGGTTTDDGYTCKQIWSWEKESSK